ncbi:MAG: RDD family protein [Bacteriovoracaceae bacterium]
MDRRYLLKSQFRIARISRLIAKAIDLFIVVALSLLLYPLGLIIACVYMAIADSLNGGQSFGKKFMGFSVISLIDGKPCSRKQSLIRNLPILIPLSFCVINFWGWIFAGVLATPLFFLELYLMFKLDSAHRLGDVMADTTVIANDAQRVDLRQKKESWYESKNVIPS